MKIIKPSVEFYGTVPTDYESALEFIEKAGRTCYKSESKGEPEKFVKKLIQSGHLAMVEHSNFVVKTEGVTTNEAAVILIQSGKYLNVVGGNNNTIYVGGSLTAWFNRLNEILITPEDFYKVYMFRPFIADYGVVFNKGIFCDDFSWEVCPHNEIPKELHRYSVKFICDRGVSHELVRHRPCSFAQESTRYVDYEGKDMEFIEPSNFNEWSADERYIFERSCILSEGWYGKLRRNNMKPQQARAILPNSLKTEIVVTADAAEWSHIRKLRTAKDCHPDMQRIMNMIPWNEFV